jgi:hypothetical protein
MGLAGLAMGVLCSFGEPAGLGIVPPAVQGQSAAQLEEQMQGRLSTGLASFQPTLLPTASECADEACVQAAAGSAGLRAVVWLVVSAESRDYVLRTRLIDAVTGEVVRADEMTCEICTYEDALEQLDQEIANLQGPVEQLLRTAPGGPSATIRVVSDPSDAVVRVDGTVVGATPWTGELPPGRHQIEVGKEGFAPTRRSVDLAADDDQALELSLRRSTAVGWKKIVGWGGVGLGVPLLATGIALLVLDENPHQPSCHGDSVDANGTCEFRYDTLAGGVVTLLGGLAAGGVGVTFLVLDHKEQRQVTATLAPGGVGLAGRF